MASGTELAKAYVQVVPSAEGIKGSLTGLLDGESQTAGEQSGSIMGNSIASKLKAVIAAAGIGTAVKDIVESAVEIGTATESAYAKLETISGSENIDMLKTSIQQLSNETGVACSDLADVAYNAISAGSSAEDAMTMVEAATKLGTAGFTDSSSALSILSTVMNSYGDSAGTAAEISDSLITVQNLGVTTVEELAGTMGKSISTASAYDVSLGNLESAYVSMTKAGINTQQSTTYLNSMLNELGDSGSTVSGILQDQTGMSFTELMDSGASLGDVLGILYDYCDGDATAMMNLWSSSNAGLAANALVNQGLDEFNSNLEEIEGSAGATETAYDTMSNTMEHQIDVMKNSFSNLSLSIYDGLQGPLGDAVGFISDTVVPGLSSLMDGTGDFGEVLGDVVSGAGELITDLGTTILKELPGIIDTIVTGLIDATPQIIQAAIDMLHGIIDALPEVIDGLVDAIPDIINAITDFFADSYPDLIDAAIDLMMALVDAIPEIIDALVDAIPDIIEAAINALITAVPQMIQAGVKLFMALVQAIPQIIQELIKAIPEIITAIVQGLANGASQIWEKAKEIGSEFLNTIIEWFSQVPGEIWNAICDAIESVGEWASEIWSSIKEWAETIADDVFTWFSELPGQIWDGISGAFEKVSDWADELWKSFKSGIKSIVDSAFGWGEDIINSIVDGINSAIEWVKTAASNVGNAIKNFLGFSLPEEGPLADADTYMPDFMGLLAEGIEDDKNLVIDEVEDLAKDVADAATFDGGGLNADVSTNVNHAWTSQEGELLELLEYYLPLLANLKVYMNGTALVGEIAPDMNKELGRISVKEARRG